MSGPVKKRCIEGLSPVHYWLYNLLASFVFLLSLPLSPLLLFLGPRYRHGLAQRLGCYSKTVINSLAGSRPLWIHAASVGEVRSAARFIQEVKARLPHQTVLLSTFTHTGHVMAQQATRADAVIFLPLDFPWIVRRAVAKLNPLVLVIIETEIWPNLVRATSDKGIPTLLLSGRLSPRSLLRYSRFKSFFQRVIQCFSVMGMQSAGDVERIVALGADRQRVSIVGNLKQAAASHSAARNVGPIVASDKEAAGKSLLVVGSSHRGEEDLILRVFRTLKERFPKLQMVLAPRHPQRFSEVERLLKAGGCDFEKKSEINGRIGVQRDILFLDTLGDLEDFYAVGDVAFVGGSLVDAGGHNLLEPARYRKPVLFGPYMTNFSALAAEMKQKGGGIEVNGADDLIRELSSLFSDRNLRASMGEKAYAIAAADVGVLERSFSLVARYLS